MSDAWRVSQALQRKRMAAAQLLSCALCLLHPENAATVYRRNEKAKSRRGRIKFSRVSSLYKQAKLGSNVFVQSAHQLDGGVPDGAAAGGGGAAESGCICTSIAFGYFV